MGQALGDVLPLAVAIAIFPVPVIAVVLMVGSDRGWRKGLVFVIAWCVGLAAVGALVLVLADAADADDAGESATWADLLLLGLGLLVLAAAVRQWRGRSRAGDEPPTPVWMRTVADFSMARAGVAGIALSALNPKNVLLAAAAATEIAEVGLPGSQQIVVLLAFVLVASVGVLTPVVLTLALGERSRQPLERVKNWMGRNNAAIMTVLLLFIAAKLIGDAVAGLSG